MLRFNGEMKLRTKYFSKGDSLPQHGKGDNLPQIIQLVFGESFFGEYGNLILDSGPHFIRFKITVTKLHFFQIFLRRNYTQKRTLGEVCDELSPFTISGKLTFVARCRLWQVVILPFFSILSELRKSNTQQQFKKSVKKSPSVLYDINIQWFPGYVGIRDGKKITNLKISPHPVKTCSNNGRCYNVRISSSSWTSKFHESSRRRRVLYSNARPTVLCVIAHISRSESALEKPREAIVCGTN